MNKITLKIVDKQNNIKAAKSDDNEIVFTYRGEYHPGDQLVIESEQVPRYLMLRLEDTMEHCLIYLTSPVMSFVIPFADDSRVYNENAFRGGKHFLWVRDARDYEIYHYRNLAYNPYFQLHQEGVYPSVHSSIGHNNIRFACRNVIDGCFDTAEHGSYPFTSWSNNQKEDAQLILDFGREVMVDACIFYLRADFPHDSWWQELTLFFSETEQEVLSLERTGKPQLRSFAAKQCNRLILSHLIKGNEPAAFTALSQIEVLGYTVK